MGKNLENFTFNGKSVLITGGTGSLGKGISHYILNNHRDIKELVIYSRDERKQSQMAREFPTQDFPQIRFVIGDVRDKERLLRVFHGVDYVIHTAAMKDVHTAEYNPEECIKTNIGGAENVIDACLKNNVKRLVSLSTDKACAPVSLYGATKLVSDKLFIAANHIRSNDHTKFSVVRYGNIMGSNGSVIPFFLKRKEEGLSLPITDPNMTRFNISLESAVTVVMYALENSWGGEIIVPKLPSYKIMDVANAIGQECEKPIVGIRPGEKVHEEMISSSDSFYTYNLGNYYAILPSKTKWSINEFISFFNAKKVQEGFSYNSGDNEEWETVSSLRNLFKSIN